MTPPESEETASLAGLPYRPCVGVMVLNRRGLVWAGHRVSKSPSDPEGPERWWQMPQGGIDASEDPVAAALRELAEETGITSVGVVAVSPTWRTYDFRPQYLRLQRGGVVYRGQTQRWVAVSFSGADDEIDIAPKPGFPAEFTRWRWVAMPDLPKLVAPFKRMVYTAVVGEFAHLQNGR